MPKSKPKPSKKSTQRAPAPAVKRAAKIAKKPKAAPKKMSHSSPKTKPAPKTKPVAKAKVIPTSKPKSTPKAAPKAASKPVAPKPATKGTLRPMALPPGKKGPVTVASLMLNQTPKTDDSKLNPFLRKQKERLLALRDSMLDSMQGMAQDNLRSRAEGSEASAFGMHQGDAGSDAYDRDFALSLLSQEQDALNEIEEALKRIENDTYGKCEMSGKPIAHPRLEAIPFTRYTVECQTQIERQNRNQRVRPVVTSLFGLTDEEGGDTEEEEKPEDTRDRERE